MDTCQLRNCVKQDDIMSENFLGVFPRDRVPRYIGDGSLIANTDKSTEEGTHWVTMYKENNICEFFDSYGRPPFKNKFTGKNFKHNKIKLQSIYSDVCGQYCLYFLYHRSRGITLDQIVETLKVDGDVIVKNFIQQNFDICTKGVGLCCTSLMGRENL